MKTLHKKILLLTSMPPSHSAGLGQDIIDSLRKAGYDVDVLIKEGYPDMPANVKSVYPYDPIMDIKRRMLKNPIIRGINNALKKAIGKKKNNENPADNAFIYADESHPAVDIDLLLSCINKEYDAVITLFWHYFLTTQSLKAVYDKLQCPIIIYSVDMAPLTGGCFYFGQCRRMTEKCGKCPLLQSKEADDLSRRNFEIKQQNYQSMDCVYLGNTWMNTFAASTHLFKQQDIQYCSIVINEREFSPTTDASDRYPLPDGKDFTIMFRTAGAGADSIRKGAKYQAEIMDKLYRELTEEERRRILLLTVGTPIDADFARSLRFDIKPLGTVNQKELIRAYRTADLFLSTSIDDAGPSMVNQSMLCGTPVASFQIGTALDLIQNKETGITSPIGTTDPIVAGIKKMIRNKDYSAELGKKARAESLRHNSYKAFSDKITSILIT